MAPGSLDLVQGTLEFLILKTLGNHECMHGFEILEWIYETTDEALAIEEGSLYPALHRMQRRGLIGASWGVSPRGRRAKYYSLSETGRQELQIRQRRWTDYVAAVDKLSGAAG